MVHWRLLCTDSADRGPAACWLGRVSQRPHWAESQLVSDYLLILKHTGYIAELIQSVEEDVGDRVESNGDCGPEKKSNLKILNE